MKKRLHLFCIVMLAFIGIANVNAQQVIVSTGFDGFPTTAPAGWYVSSTGVYTTNGNFGFASPSLRMSNNTVDSLTTIITPSFSGADTLSCWIKLNAGGGTGGLNAPLSTMNVYESPDSTNWTLISSADSLPTTGTTVRFPISANTQNVKITYHKFAGNLAIDDIKLTHYVPGVPFADFSSSVACIGDSTSFTDHSVINGGTITNWAWTFGDASAPVISQNPKHLYSTAGTYIVTLLVSDNTLDTNSISYTVNVNPKPVPTFTATPVSGCAPLAVLFTDVSTISAGTLLTDRWYFGNGDTTRLNNIDTLYTYNTPGTFTVRLGVVSQAGCFAIDSLVNLVTVSAAPVSNYSFSTTGMTTAFTNAATGAATYDWNFGDGTAHATSTDPSHTYAAPGSYTVCLTATSANSCTDSVCKNVVIADPTGIKTNEGGRLSISPNPSQGLFNINFGEAVEGSVSIKVYSILGQEVRNFETRRTSAATYVLDLTGSDKGVYFIQITSAKGVQTTRVSISR